MFLSMLSCRHIVARTHNLGIIVLRHGRPQGGARGGTCPPPLEIQKYGAPTRINYRVKIKKKIFFKLSEETELRAPPPHLVSEETDMRGPL